MGILDDLAMGFGLKERTADYDARTARTIAANAASDAVRSRGGSDHAASVAGLRARQSYDYSAPTGQSAYYLDRAGGTGYRPEIAEDSRPFMQRLMTSPSGDASPRPYAIGPVTLDQPLPAFGLLGLFTNGLSSMFQGQDDSGEMGPPLTTVRPMLRPEGFASPNFPAGNGQPETTFDTRTEAEPIDYSDGIPVADPALIPAIEALALDDGYDPAYKDVEDYLQKVEREAQGMRLITRGPHAGKYVDASGRLVMP